MNLTDLLGKWKSEKKFGPFNYKSNFENWINATACNGHFKLILSYDIDNSEYFCKVYIPVTYYADFVLESNSAKELDNVGFYVIYKGRVELKNKFLLIWQNEKAPIKIYCVRENKTLRVELFGQNMVFNRLTEEITNANNSYK